MAVSLIITQSSQRTQSYHRDFSKKRGKIDLEEVNEQPNYEKVKNYRKWLKNKLTSEGSELVSNTNQLKIFETVTNCHAL